MNAARLLRIANRINLLLMRELGEGIDVQRLIAQPVYARDVLLVCDALPGSDLASLAQHFRVALVEPIDEHGHPSSFGAESSGFALSRPSRPSHPSRPSLPSLQVGDSQIEMNAGPPPAAPRPWFSPGRWLGR